MAVSILFLVQDVTITPKVSERLFSGNSSDSIGRPHDFSKVVGGVMVIGMCLCWMWKKPIGRDDTKVSRVWVLYRDWLYRRKISKKFWRAKMGRGCWRYRGPIAVDDTQEWWIWARYREWPIRRESGSRKYVKNQVKWRILLVWDAPWTVLSENWFRNQDFI